MVGEVTTVGPSIIAVRQKKKTSELEDKVLHTAAPGELKFSASDGFQRELIDIAENSFLEIFPRQMDNRRPPYYWQVFRITIRQEQEN